MSKYFGLRQGGDWLPTTLEVEGLDIPLYRFDSLSQSSARVLLTRAKTIRDRLGADRLPPLVPGTAEVCLQPCRRNHLPSADSACIRVCVALSRFS